MYNPLLDIKTNNKCYFLNISNNFTDKSKKKECQLHSLCLIGISNFLSRKDQDLVQHSDEPAMNQQIKHFAIFLYYKGRDNRFMVFQHLQCRIICRLYQYNNCELVRLRDSCMHNIFQDTRKIAQSFENHLHLHRQSKSRGNGSPTFTISPHLRQEIFQFIDQSIKVTVHFLSTGELILQSVTVEYVKRLLLRCTFFVYVSGNKQNQALSLFPRQ